MKILQITSHLNVGGISRYVLSLSRHLAGKGHQVCIASAGGSLEKSCNYERVRFLPVPLNTSQEFSPRIFKTVRELTCYLEREPVDVIHAHTRVAQVVADRVSRRMKIPYVTTWHGIYKRRIGRLLYPCTGDAVIAISGIVREHLLKDFQVPSERIHLVYNGIDTAYHAVAPDDALIRKYRDRFKIPEGRPVIGGIGRLAAGEVKGFDLLLAAACLLKETFPDIQVLIVGDGPRRPFLEDVAERLGIFSQVHFVGGVEDVRVPLSFLDVFVFPSRWPEAFGLTLIEAMAAGKAIVATRMGAVSEILRDGRDGWVVPPEDIQAIAEKIAMLLSDPALARTMGQQAQLRAHDQFDIGRMVTEVEQVYEEVINKQKSY